MYRLLLASACLLLVLPSPLRAQIGPDRFEHHFITRDLPGDKTWGYGTPALADFDDDGDLDFAVSVRQERIYWFAYEGAARWQRRVLGRIPIRSLGSTTMDVDRDGWTDMIVGGYWYRNPGPPHDQPFTRYRYDRSIDTEIHDMVTADVDGDDRLDLVVSGDEEGAYWYRVPAEPAADEDWPRTPITRAVLDSSDDIHATFFPGGVKDLDADGDADVVMPDRWLENESSGQSWTPHDLPFGKRGPWGLSARSVVVDLDRDGDQDIVLTDADQQQSRAAWLESDGGGTPRFTAHYLPQQASGQRGSFHSLAVADFDGDADLDIFTVEQEDGSIFPEGASPRWYIWENLDGQAEHFAERVIYDGRLGGHDALTGDVDGDGDIDIVSKIWKRWADNANAGREHADFLENLTR